MGTIHRGDLQRILLEAIGCRIFTAHKYFLQVDPSSSDKPCFDSCRVIAVISTSALMILI